MKCKREVFRLSKEAVAKYITLEDAQDLVFGKEIVDIDTLTDAIGFVGHSIRFQDKDHTKQWVLLFMGEYIYLLQ